MPKSAASPASDQPAGASGTAAPPVASPPAMLLAGSLGLVALGVLPLVGGGYSGPGYLVELVLMPLCAALGWAVLGRRRPLLTQAVLLLYLLAAVGLPFWVEEGRNVWAWVLALPLAWVLVWLTLTSLPERRDWLLPVLSGSALVTALFGLWLWATSGHTDTRITSTFGLPNAYAGYLLVAWPLAGVGLLRARVQLERTLYGLAGLLLIAAFVLTYSRAAWAVFALQLLALGLVALSSRLRRKPSPAPASGATDAVGMAGPASRLPRWPLYGLPVLLLGLLALPSMRAVLGRVTDFGGYSMTGRWRFWEGALAIWRDHPLLGVGPGNFAFYYPQYQRDPFFYSIDPHSWVMQLLCELGIPGVLIALAVIAGAVFWLRRIWRRLPAGEAALLSVALVGSLLHAAVDFDYTFSATTALLGALLAYGTWRAQGTVAAASSPRSSTPNPTIQAAATAGSPAAHNPGAQVHMDSNGGGTPPPRERILAWITTGLLVLVAVWGTSFAAERYVLDRLRDTPGLPLELQRQLLEQAIQYNPFNHYTHNQLASILAQPGAMNDRDRALAEVEIAIRLNPRYAVAYALRGLLARPPKAGEPDLEKALTLDPYNYPEHYFAYASVAADEKTRLERLKDGIEKLNIVDPITPSDVRSDWVKWNGLFARWYYEMARLTPEKGPSAQYRERAARFEVAADAARKAAEQQQGAPPPAPDPGSSST